MKALKRMLALVLVVIMVMSTLTIPASAASIGTMNWKGAIAGFPQLYNGSTQNGYIKMLQRFLLLYPYTYSTIVNGGGVDGGFGNKTQAAVETFQKNELGANEADGYVGTKTWTAIASLLTRYGSLLQYNQARGAVYSGLTTNVVLCAESGYYVYMYTYNQSNVAFSTYFHYIT